MGERVRERDGRGERERERLLFHKDCNLVSIKT